jgi:type I restriction enzyme, S subunit
MTVVTAQLGDICEVVMGQSPPSATYNVYGRGLPFFQGKVDFGEIYPQTRIFCSEPVRIAQRGDILISVRAPVGPTNLAREKCCIGRGLSAIRPSEKIDARFLLYFLRYYEPQLVQRGLGSTFSAINRDDLEDIPVPVLSIVEQRRVARRLAEADDLRTLRRYTLQVCDEILPAVFLDMFGNPVTNTRLWEQRELEELANVERGKLTPRPRNDPSYYGGKFPFIQTGDITESRGRVRFWKQTLNEKGRQVSRSFPPGTIVIAIVGATIGMTAILEVEVFCPDSVVGIQVNAECATKEYIEFVLRFWRPTFLAQAPETARANINLETLRPLRIPVPPLRLQQQFSRIVESCERLRATHIEAVRQADHLFQTLLDQAFSLQ